MDVSANAARKRVSKLFSDLTIADSGGIASWLCGAPDFIFERLGNISSDPLSYSQLNQLLVFGHQAPISPGFFEYYWLKVPSHHPYKVQKLDDFDRRWEKGTTIQSLEHLRWGLRRLFVDALLLFGNVRTGYRTLRGMSCSELKRYFGETLIDTDFLIGRGPALPLNPIEKRDRHLVGEIPAKVLEGAIMLNALQAAYEGLQDPEAVVTVEKLVTENLTKEFQNLAGALKFATHGICDTEVANPRQIADSVASVEQEFQRVRLSGKENTKRYLSAVGDLDVYVATSMRVPEHFLAMAEFCEEVFSSDELREFNLRYFDPTMSSASTPEDKGLIECLMVKCAKVLIYCGDADDSFGKDAEAAMALSLGKPVIFYSPKKATFLREVHPLARLIDFDTGVAVGAIITDSRKEIPGLLRRILDNDLEYDLDKDDSGYLRLRERTTGSVVRLQTSDKMISETFWNHYHKAGAPGD